MRTALVRHASSRLLKSQPDHVLVELAHAGHEPAFEAIVMRYGHHLLRVARAVGPSEGAEDVLQQALLQAYRALRRHEEVAELRPWLRRIVLNASVDLSRRTGPRPEAVREEQLVGEGVESVLERQQQLTRLVRALGELPDRQRKAIVMRELEGRPIEEIASEFGTSNGAARQLVRRARAQLRVGVAALVPPALLARMLAYSAPQPEAVGSQGAELAGAGGIGMAARLGTAVAVGGSALVVGTFAPSLDQGVRQPPVPQPAVRRHAAPAARAGPATRAPQPSEPSTHRHAGQPAGRQGVAGQAGAAEVGQHDGQSQSGQGSNVGDAQAGQDQQVQQGGGGGG